MCLNVGQIGWVNIGLFSHFSFVTFLMLGWTRPVNSLHLHTLATFISLKSILSCNWQDILLQKELCSVKQLLLAFNAHNFLFISFSCKIVIKKIISQKNFWRSEVRVLYLRCKISTEYPKVLNPKAEATVSKSVSFVTTVT